LLHNIFAVIEIAAPERGGRSICKHCCYKQRDRRTKGLFCNYIKLVLPY